MNRTILSIFPFLCFAVAGCGGRAEPCGTKTLRQTSEKSECAMNPTHRITREVCGTLTPLFRLSGEGVVADVAPTLGGRLMSFCSTDESQANGSSTSESVCRTGSGVLWTAPSNSLVTDGWRNHGGEKTWVGDMSLWRGFDPKGRRWPPPAWFDQDELEAVSSTPTGLVLRSGVHTNDDWRVALERAFRFEGDRLVIRESLLSDSADNPSTNDPRRVWSVTQVPFAPRLAARLVGESRLVPSAGFPDPGERLGGWVLFDLATVPDKAALACDADALAVEGPAGWLVVSQRADARFLGAFAEPGRALVYTTGAKPDAPAAAYTELEFVALGPAASQEISFQILPPGCTPWDAEDAAAGTAAAAAP